MATIKEAIEEAKSYGVREESDLIIYENVASGTENDFTIAKKSHGIPPSYPDINRIFEVKAKLVYEDGEMVVEESPDDVDGPSTKKVRRDNGSDQLFIGKDCVIVYEDGSIEKSQIADLSKTQIQTQDGMKFKKSDLESGWGSPPAKLSFDLSKLKDTEVDPQNLNNLKQGQELLISSGAVETVKKISARQIRTDNYKFKKSDGKQWGGGDLYIASVM